MAKVGDIFLPMAGWNVGAMAQARVGIEVTWPLSEADLRAGKLQRAQLVLGATKARELARSLLEQAEIAERRARPN
jgi:hypothetical protein